MTEHKQFYLQTLQSVALFAPRKCGRDPQAPRLPVGRAGSSEQAPASVGYQICHCHLGPMFSLKVSIELQLMVIPQRMIPLS